MKLHDYAQLDGIAIATAIASRDISQTEVIEVAISAIELLNPQLNAVVIENYEKARAVASAVMQKSLDAQTSTIRPLAGVPFLLKDVNVFSHDMPTTFSCRFFEHAKPQPDSQIVKRWRAAGLNILGKTNTPEFAGDFVTESTFRGPALNPWDPALTTGGSSGGAGSAVASCMVPIAHGTDLGGSIRIPAACCGVFGFKPSSGLNPVDYSHLELANGFNSDHVLTRSVRDSAAALDATAMPLTGFRYRTTRSVPSFLAVLDEPSLAGLNQERPLRIGVCTQTPDATSVPERQSQAVQVVANCLSAQGFELCDYQYPDSLDMGSWLESLWMLDVAHELNQHIAQTGREPQKDELEALTWFLREKVETLSAMDYYDSRRRVHLNSVKLMKSMDDIDLLLTPALGIDPVPVGSFDSRTAAFDYAEWSKKGYEFAPFSYVCNMTGQPAASLPVRLGDSLMPCAVQLAGKNAEDHKVLQLSALLEQALQWQNYRPPISVAKP